jgi:hypothetical protein
MTMAKAPATRSIGFSLAFDVAGTLNTLGVMLVVLKLIGLAPIGWLAALSPFIAQWAWTMAFRRWSARFRARHAVKLKTVRRVQSDVEAIGWSVAMGLVPGYGHGNAGMSLDDRRTYLATSWTEIMFRIQTETGFLVTAVLSEAKALYPGGLGCPDGGEHVVMLSGSSNPTKVSPEQFDDYVAAVERAVHLLRDVMEQNSVRIEFVRVARSSYFRADGRY